MELNLRYYKATPLFFSVLALAAIFDLVIKNVILPLHNLLEVNTPILRAPGNVALIGLVLFLYNKYAWRWPGFRLLVKVPDMSGRYKGKIKYTYNNQPGEKECIVEVVQTGSSIKIHSYFNNAVQEQSSSRSLVENIEEEDGFYHLYLFYLNSGARDGTLDCHEGAQHLKFIPAKDKEVAMLIGHYFNNRQIQSRGQMEVKFSDKKIKGHF